MSGQYRMGGPNYQPQRSKHTTRNRIIGVILQMVAVPMMVLLPWVFVVLPIDGIGYLAGQGEKITVTVTQSFRVNATSLDDPGSGYYIQDGKQQSVSLDNMEEGDRISARIAATSDPDDADPKAYAGTWPAIVDIVWGAIFMSAGVFIGLGAVAFGTRHQGMKAAWATSPGRCVP